MKDEALKLALEALENTTPTGFNMERDKQFYAAITAIKQALALDKMAENARELGLNYEPTQEPVAFFCPIQGFYWAKPTKITAPVTVDVKPLPLYTPPPGCKRQWVGRTDEKIDELMYRFTRYELLYAIQAELKEKNT
jgi:hypothetical protein